MSDLINEIIAPEAMKQLDDVNKKLIEATEGMADAKKSAIELSKAMQGISLNSLNNKNAKELYEVTQQMTTAQEGATAAQKKYNDSLSTAEAIKAKYNGSSKEFVAVAQGVANVTLKEAQAAKASAQEKKILAEYTAKLTKEQERIEKATAKATAELEKQNNAYEQAKKQYSQLAAEAKKLAFEYGENDSRAKEAAASALALSSRLLAVEKSVGDARRQVGHYNTATMAMSQVLREAPSFAYSFATGLLAISNNIPILVDEIQKLKTVNEGLRASGEKTIPIWKTLGEAITSPAGVITIVTSLFTILAARMTMAGGAMSETEIQAKKLKDSLLELSYTMSEKLQDEIDKATVLFKTAADVGASYHARTEAINDLLKLYPELLANLSQEAALNGQVAAQQNAVLDVIYKKNHAEELKGKIDVLKKQRDEAKKDLDTYDPSAFAVTGNFLVGRDPQKDKQSKVDMLNKQLKETEDLAAIVNQQIDYMLNPKHDGRILSDIDADIKAQERLRDTTEAGTDAHRNALTQIKKLNDERADYLGQEDKKEKARIVAGINAEFEAEKALAQAKYELERHTVEDHANAQKRIYEDNSKSLDDRLNAYLDYQNDLVRIAELERTKEISIQHARLKQLDEKEQAYRSGKIKLTSDEVKAISILREAAHIQLEDAERAFTTKSNDIMRGWGADTKGIIKSSTDEWIKQLEMSFDVELLKQAQHLVEDEQLLQKAFEERLLTRKEFDTKMKTLQDKAHVIQYETELELDNKVLANDKLTAEERIKWEQKRINDTKALNEARAASSKDTNAGKTFQHVTDPIANFFADHSKFKDDLDKRKQYLQEFYDTSVKLAQQAVDTMSALEDDSYQKKITQLDKEANAVDIVEKDKIYSIQFTAQTQQQAVAEVSQAEAQAEASRRTIEAQKKAEAVKKANFDRGVAIASIVFNTAAAIIKALDTYGMPAAIPIMAAEAGIGAAQLVKASNAPLPQYRRGIGIGNGEHPGGAFIAGDGGERELIAPPDKAPYWSNPVSSLYSEAAGTKVIPLSKITQHIANSQIAANFPGSKAIDNSHILNGLRDDINTMSENIVHMLGRTANRPINVNVHARNAAIYSKVLKSK